MDGHGQEEGAMTEQPHEPVTARHDDEPPPTMHRHRRAAARRGPHGRARRPWTRRWGPGTTSTERSRRRPVARLRRRARRRPRRPGVAAAAWSSSPTAAAAAGTARATSSRGRAARRPGYGTLLLDLLTEDEERIDARTRALRFDIALLAGRLIAAADWLRAAEPTPGCRSACFGASTGAAAALITAADRPDGVGAVISRGGRPDLAGARWRRVRAPTLLIVGGADRQVLELNRQAAARLAAEHEIAVIPGATHLFPEEGALEQVVDRSVAWLDRSQELGRRRPLPRDPPTASAPRQGC